VATFRISSECRQANTAYYEAGTTANRLQFYRRGDKGVDCPFDARTRAARVAGSTLASRISLASRSASSSGSAERAAHVPVIT